MKLWSMTDELNKQNMTFGGSTQLPFVGFLRVDGAMYRFMGSKELPMQAIAPMALDHEKWEGKFTSLVPDEGWEQPDFDDKYWQLSEGAFGRNIFLQPGRLSLPSSRGCRHWLRMYGRR